jgi:hypothetical protein
MPEKVPILCLIFALANTNAKLGIKKNIELKVTIL